MSDIFAKAAKAYKSSPFAGALVPLPEGQKKPPLAGRTGREGITTRETVKADAAAHPSHNVGLRMPPGYIGLDVDGVDHGEGKTGPESIVAFEQLHGDLPATASTSRHGADSDTRIHVFEVPAGVRFREKFFGGSIEVIQHHHRFAVVWPSRLEDGSRYRWYDAERNEIKVPTAEHIERLPDAWIDALRDDRAETEEHRISDGDVAAWVDSLAPGELSAHVAHFIESIPAEDIGNTNLLGHVGSLVRAIHGQPGAAAAYTAFVEHIRPHYLAKYDSRKMQTDLERALSRAIGDHLAELDQRVEFPTIDPHPVSRTELDMVAGYAFAAPLPPARRREKKTKGEKKGGGKKKRARSGLAGESFGRAAEHIANLDHDEYVPRGTIGLTANPAAPEEVGADLLAQRVLPPLVHWRDAWYVYEDHFWAPRATSYVENIFRHALAGASFANGDKTARWAPTIQKIREVMRAVQARVEVEASARAPFWLDGTIDRPDRLIPMRNCLVDPVTGDVHPRSWRYFNLGGVEYDFDPAAPEPTEWLDFLARTWPDEPESIQLLQEWFGYVLSGDLSHHKMMLLYGATRSGKGVISRILERLVGSRQTMSTSLAALGGDFGMEPLLDASLILMPDARSMTANSNRDTSSSRLLEISGGDRVHVNRKGRSQVTARLPGRVMILSNSIPMFFDDTGAIAGRFLLLQTTESHLGREDRGLEGRIARQTAQIVPWAIEGYRRLRERGMFTTPPSMVEGTAQMRRNAAPILEFIEERCLTMPGSYVTKADLFRAYQEWCRRGNIGDASIRSFGRAVIAAGFTSRQRTIDGVRQWVYYNLCLTEEVSAQQKASMAWSSPADDRLQNPS